MIDETRFWQMVDDSGGPDACWPWQGQMLSSGYGRVRVEAGPRGRRRAHRIALTIAAGGPTREAPYALHSCDNPPCCNPGHLRWGTQADNIADAVARERSVSPPANAMKGVANPYAKLDPERIARIRAALETGRTQRAIAREFGVAQSTISDINTGRKWSHL